MSKLQIIRKLLWFGQKLFSGDSKGVVILGYHLVGGATGLRVDLSEDIFRRQMQELKTRTHAASLQSAADWIQDGRERNQPIAVVTFDDAFENFYTRVWPILHTLSIPATLFVPVGFIEKESGNPIAYDHPLEPLSWSQLSEMASSGLLTVGSHGWHHRDMRKIAADDARKELARSRRVLEDRLGVRVNAFCYPRGQWSGGAERIVQEIYDYAVVAGGRKVTPKNFHPFRLRRVPITRDMPASIEPVIRARVWIEEWFADKWRRYVR